MLPFSAAVSRVASDLGLLASAAAEDEGNIALGGFLKAIEVLRQQSCHFDSASDLIGFLEQLEESGETEGCTALPPSVNVVRVMNLHKAKGLEAPVVFLADTSSAYGGSPICHIDHSTDQPLGYMGIMVDKGTSRFRGKKEVATPADWPSLQEEEQRFLDAERDRLLYVATTRAACMLIISIGKDNSNWSGLHQYLADAPELAVPDAESLTTERTPLAHREVAFSGPGVGNEVMQRRWSSAGAPSYMIESAKEVALKGSTRPDWQASGEYGYKWGSAIHELLEVAAKSPSADLRLSAIPLIGYYELGGQRVDELVSTVRSVIDSEIWQRSQQAKRCFSELPLETVSKDDEGRPVITRGVVDLLFEQPDGWVIVDYKTDDITESDVASAADYYRPQLQRYATEWTEQTGYATSEQGLYFTRIQQYVAVS